MNPLAARALALCAVGLVALASCEGDSDRPGAGTLPVLPSNPGGGGPAPIGQPIGAEVPLPDIIGGDDVALTDVPLTDAPLTDTPQVGTDIGPIEPFPGDGVGAFPGDGVGAFPGDGAGAFPGDTVGAFPGDTVGAFPGDAIDPSPGTDDPGPLPGASGASFLEWVQSGVYLDFIQASDLHQTAVHGPIRTFMNESLFTSVATGSFPVGLDQHPEGAVAIAEQFTLNPPSFQGWLGMVKVQPDSQGGQGWFFFQSRPNGPPIVAQPNAGACATCHSTGDDFIMAPFPAE